MGNEIYKFNISTNAESTVTEGHYAPNTKALNEVWGLDIKEDKGATALVTCGDDGTCRIFDSVKREQVMRFDLTVDASGTKLPPHPKTKDLNHDAWGRSVAICKE